MRACKCGWLLILLCSSAVFCIEEVAEVQQMGEGPESTQCEESGEMLKRCAVQSAAWRKLVTSLCAASNLRDYKHASIIAAELTEAQDEVATLTAAAAVKCGGHTANSKLAGKTMELNEVHGSLKLCQQNVKSSDMKIAKLVGEITTAGAAQEVAERQLEREITKNQELAVNNNFQEEQLNETKRENFKLQVEVKVARGKNNELEARIAKMADSQRDVAATMAMSLQDASSKAKAPAKAVLKHFESFKKKLLELQASNATLGPDQVKALVDSLESTAEQASSVVDHVNKKKKDEFAKLQQAAAQEAKDKVSAVANDLNKEEQQDAEQKVKNTALQKKLNEAEKKERKENEEAREAQSLLDQEQNKIEVLRAKNSKLQQVEAQQQNATVKLEREQQANDQLNERVTEQAVNITRTKATIKDVAALQEANAALQTNVTQLAAEVDSLRLTAKQREAMQSAFSKNSKTSKAKIKELQLEVEEWRGKGANHKKRKVAFKLAMRKNMALMQRIMRLESHVKFHGETKKQLKAARVEAAAMRASNTKLHEQKATLATEVAELTEQVADEQTPQNATSLG